MADPLSVGASVVGLISVATHVSSKLLEFVGDSNDAPALARHVMSEIYAIKAAITSLQTYLWGEARATGSQESMVLVEHLAVALTACVFTFNELEKEVSALKSGYNMKTLERVKWARKKGAIAQLFARLQNHKSSLSLILDILQSQTNTHAERSLENLYVAISETLNFQREIAERLKRLETGVGPARSTLTVREDSLAVDTSSLYSFQSASSRRTARAIVSKFRFAFDATLETSRVYRRSKLRYLGSPEGSGSSSIAARSMGWSFMSGLSIADISQVSVLSLPIYSLDLPNSKFYTFNYKTRHSEAASGEEDAVQVLPKISSSIDVVDQKDLWVEKLHITAARGLTDEVQLLINDGVDISTIWENETALGRASRGGHKDTVELLLSKGADISAVNKGEWTALHHAARYGHKDTVELLLSKGADISAVDKDKWTALHHAAIYVYKDTVGLLLSKGADISAVDKEGRTVLHHAAGYERKSMVEFLLSKGADILAVDKGEWTALHYAARYGYKDMVELLLSRGADVSAVDKDKWTALHHAARCRDKDMVELLLSKGADISAVDRDKWTALHHAARYGHKDTVELLLSKGADILAVDRDKWTALHHAARYGYKDTVEFLLSKGADISAVDKDQWTALHHAARYGYKDTAELLLSKGGVPSAVMRGVRMRGVRTTLILATEIRRADIAKIIESYPKGKGLSIQDSAKVPSTGNSETPITLEGQPPTTELSTVVE